MTCLTKRIKRHYDLNEERFFPSGYCQILWWRKRPVWGEWTLPISVIARPSTLTPPMRNTVHGRFVVCLPPVCLSVCLSYSLTFYLFVSLFHYLSECLSTPPPPPPFSLCLSHGRYIFQFLPPHPEKKTTLCYLFLSRCVSLISLPVCLSACLWLFDCLSVFGSLCLSCLSMSLVLAFALPLLCPMRFKFTEDLDRAVIRALDLLNRGPEFEYWLRRHHGSNEPLDLVWLCPWEIYGPCDCRGYTSMCSFPYPLPLGLRISSVCTLLCVCFKGQSMQRLQVLKTDGLRTVKLVEHGTGQSGINLLPSPPDTWQP